MPKIKQENMDALTAERLREVVHYNPETGIFTWLVTLSASGIIGSNPGSIVGNYLGFAIDGVKYYCHRLAWLYMTGAWPTQEIDHRNCIWSDNRWDNLRESSSSQNKHNSRVRRRAASGVKGVSKSGPRCRKPWKAEICRDYKRTQLGMFDTIEEAAAPYAAAAAEYHGDFARTE